MLSNIFTKKNLEILVFITSHEYHIRDIADALKCSPAKVHNAIKLFKTYNLIREEKIKNRNIVIVNKESLLLKKIMELLKLEKERKD